jgi:hypothetical protein
MLVDAKLRCESTEYRASERASRAEQPSRGHPGEKGTQRWPWRVRKSSNTDEPETVLSGERSEAPRRQVVCRGYLSPEAGKTLEKENRAPRMWRYDNESATRTHHAFDGRHREILVREMVESPDEQHEFEPFIALAAKLRRIGNAESEAVVVYVAPGTLDHRFADIHPDASFDDRQELNEHLPGSKVENARADQGAAYASEIADPCSEFRRSRRSGAMLCIP